MVTYFVRFMEVRRDVFQAIADPTRRAIIQMLAQKPLNLNAVAGQFDISRPAVSKHMRILTECGLVVVVKKGREHYCNANLQSLQEVQAWVAQYSEFWNRRLDVLEDLLKQDKDNANV